MASQPHVTVEQRSEALKCRMLTVV